MSLNWIIINGNLKIPILIYQNLYFEYFDDFNLKVNSMAII
jgi:hypothetical protein